jgi:dTDP-4-dehydrorhamnose 3,5-epimerase
MLNKRNTTLPGCFVIKNKKTEDERGEFVKLFVRHEYSDHGLVQEIEEGFYTSSRKSVLRGMHFQVPPYEYEKIVCCVSGKVFDVLLDLRLGSPTYGVAETFYLDSEEQDALYVPKGIAHGFCVLSDNATMAYLTTKAHSPLHDKGVSWSSIGIEWPIKNPILSMRDRSFPKLKDFDSPFNFPSTHLF